MNLPVSDPDPSVVLDLLEAFRRSKTMFAAIELGVFEELSARAATVTELAAKLAAHPEALRRLLDACVGLQLLTWDAATSNYAATAAAKAYLTRTSPQRLTGYLKFSNDVMWGLWRHLEDAVREGTHRWTQVYGWEGPIFSHFFATDESRREFLMGMHGFGQISSPHVVAAFDLSRFQRLVDLGGATGHLAVAACRRYPRMSGCLFDLPEALPLAQEMIGATDVAQRIDIVGGDFFVVPLPAGDLYALGRILHDWSEPKCITLLQRIFAALPSGGGLLVAEKLLRADKTGPRWAQMQDLNMLTCTEGRERTLDEYRSLLAGIGFTMIEGCTTDAPLDAVLAIKP